MKKLSLILPAVCILFCLDVFGQPELQAGSAVFPLFPGGGRTDSGSVINLPLTEALSHLPAGLLSPGLREDYLRKSKRQKRTAWILLGTGVALITAGFVVAANQEDAIEAGVSLVFLSGPGIITSLVSIPFFIASASNKRKANKITSSVQLLRSPVLLQNGLGYSVYPGVAMKMQF